MRNLEVKSMFFVPEKRAMVALLQDGTIVVSAIGGEWFTKPQLHDRLKAEGMDIQSMTIHLNRWIETVEAARVVVVNGAEGPVGTGYRW